MHEQCDSMNDEKKMMLVDVNESCYEKFMNEMEVMTALFGGGITKKK